MIFKPMIALIVLISFVSINTVHAESGLYDILDYDVGFDIENGDILVMDLDVNFTSLTIEIVSYDDGFVEISIPRGLLDSTFDDDDDIFYILIDGTESDYIEVDSNESIRILIIPFFINDQEIEVLGTNALSADPTEIEIPSWVKNNAGWWSEGLLQDSDFVAGIQYLIDDGVIIIRSTESEENNNEEIPSWVKNNAGWWSEGLLQDSDFVAGIQYLISNGILII